MGFVVWQVKDAVGSILKRCPSAKHPFSIVVDPVLCRHCVHRILICI